MPKFLIPVKFEQIGQFVVEADSLEAAIQAVEDDETTFSPEAVNAEYLENSFEINRECCQKISDEDHLKFYSDDKFVSLI